ncbi:MAG: hypothetical protein M3R61_14795 [Chloroflexota bacterium]|nr:hypothetical protein [Chloroflexota bacterium]
MEPCAYVVIFGNPPRDDGIIGATLLTFCVCIWYKGECLILPIAGDLYGEGMSINDRGQVAGCAARLGLPSTNGRPLWLDGSVVWYLFCRSFSPGRAKTTYSALKMNDKRTSYW